MDTMTDEQTTLKPVLLSENKQAINTIDQTAKQWLDNLNAVVIAWEKLQILTPYSINILIDHSFREWFFTEQQRVNPVLKSINISAYQFPPEVETIQRVSDWLRHDETKIQYQMFVSYSDGRYVLNQEQIERIKDERARTYANSSESIAALLIAERAERTLNALLDYLESGINGNRSERINPMTFLEWVTTPTANGIRERLRLKRELFKDGNSVMAQNEIEGLIRLIKAKK